MMALRIPAEAVALAAVAGYGKAIKFMGKHPKHKPRKAWKKFALDFDFWRVVSPDDWQEVSRQHWRLTLINDPVEIEEFWATVRRHRQQTLMGALSLVSPTKLDPNSPV
jgi:hypothetical protein